MEHLLVTTFIFLAISYSFARILCYEKITEILRMMLENTFFGVVLKCIGCTSVWTGIIISFFIDPLLMIGAPIVISNILCGFLSYWFCVIMQLKVE